MFPHRSDRFRGEVLVPSVPSMPNRVGLREVVGVSMAWGTNDSEVVDAAMDVTVSKKVHRNGMTQVVLSCGSSDSLEEEKADSGSNGNTVRAGGKA